MNIFYLKNSFSLQKRMISSESSRFWSSNMSPYSCPESEINFISKVSKVCTCLQAAPPQKKSWITFHLKYSHLAFSLQRSLQACHVGLWIFLKTIKGLFAKTSTLQFPPSSVDGEGQNLFPDSKVLLVVQTISINLQTLLFPLLWSCILNQILKLLILWIIITL